MYGLLYLGKFACRAGRSEGGYGPGPGGFVGTNYCCCGWGSQSTGRSHGDGRHIGRPVEIPGSVLLPEAALARAALRHPWRRKCP